MTIPTARSHHLIGLAFLCATAFACRARTDTAADPMMLSVENNSAFRVNVFAVPSLPSARIRLGSVGALSNDQLDLPRTAVGAGGVLKVMVDPIGSTNQWISSTVTLSNDTRPCLRVKSDASGNLSQSFLYKELGNGSACPP